MRLRVECPVPRPINVPFNHLYQLAEIIQNFADHYKPVATIATKPTSQNHSEISLHTNMQKDLGIDLDGCPPLPLCFSSLQSTRRRAEASSLKLGPGLINWIVSSPNERLLHQLANELMAQDFLRLPDAHLKIRQVVLTPSPSFEAGVATFTCLTPFVARVRRSDGRTRFLRPSDGKLLIDALHTEMLRKYRLYTGETLQASETDLTITLDRNYLAAPQHRGGTKLMRSNDNDILGIQCPFQAVGHPKLLKFLYDCGIGEQNGEGFGMVELVGEASPKYTSGTTLHRAVATINACSNTL